MDKPLAQKPVTASTVVTLDLVIVRMVDGLGPELLLIQRANDPCQGWWALPGGKLADEDATLEEGALRELREETGFVLPSSLPLRQLHTYGSRGRDPRPGRWISVAFYVPVIHQPRWLEVKHRSLCPGDDASAAQWWGVSALPALAFDHQTIVERAFEPGLLHIDRRRFR